MIRLMVIVAALAAVSAAPGATEISPRLEEGHELRYAMKFELERGLVLGAGRDRLVQEAGVLLRVESVDEEGVATVSGDIEWIVIDLDRAAFRVRVDSRDIVGDSPNLAETTIREMVQLYLDGAFELRVSPEGEVLEASGLEAIDEKIAASRGSLPRLAAGRFVMGTLEEDLEPIWSADGAAGKTVEGGDTWTTTREAPLGAGVGMTLTTDWRVERAVEDGAVFEGDVLATIDLPEMDEEIPVTFEVTEQTGTSTSAWDAEVGALRSRDAFMSYTITVSAGEQSQSSQRQGRSTLELVSPASE